MPIRGDKAVSPSGTGDRKGDYNPEVTPESKLDVSGGEFENDGCDSPRSINDLSCSGIMRLKQGLLEMDAGLRGMEVDGARLSPSRIVDIMDSIRDVLKAKAGVLVGRGNTGPGADRKGSNDKGSGLGIPPGTPSDCGMAEEKSGKDQDSLERLTSAACAAGKRGDVAALKVSTTQLYHKRVGERRPSP